MKSPAQLDKRTTSYYSDDQLRGRSAMGMGSSDNRIAVARKIDEPRDTDEELPPISGHHDTWPPEEEPTSSTPLVPVAGDTIPTPPPSSGVVEHVTIPTMPAVHIEE